MDDLHQSLIAGCCLSVRNAHHHICPFDPPFKLLSVSTRLISTCVVLCKQQSKWRVTASDGAGTRLIRVPNGAEWIAPQRQQTQNQTKNYSRKWFRENNRVCWWWNRIIISLITFSISLSVCVPQQLPPPTKPRPVWLGSFFFPFVYFSFLYSSAFIWYIRRCCPNAHTPTGQPVETNCPLPPDPSNYTQYDRITLKAYIL
jgi:hypothetical protein